jgi:hypothetical protein
VRHYAVSKAQFSQFSTAPGQLRAPVSGRQFSISALWRQRLGSKLHQDQFDTRLGAIPHRHQHTADDPVRPPLAQLERRTYMSDSLSLGGGRHHFFARRSFSAALSSMASANSFFSLAFSLSSPFRRLATPFPRRAAENHRPECQTIERVARVAVAGTGAFRHDRGTLRRGVCFQPSIFSS